MMNPIEDINSFVLRSISLGLIYPEDPLFTSFREKFPLEVKEAFCIRAARRIHFPVMDTSPVTPLPKLAGNPKPAPAKLIASCIHAVQSFDLMQIEQCDRLLREYLPYESREERWVIIAKCLYLKRVFQILQNGSVTDKLLLATPPGFCAGVSHLLTSSTADPIQKEKELNDLILRQARRANFQINLRTIVYSAVTMMIRHNDELSYDARAFDDVFTSPITDFGNRTFKPQQLDNSSDTLEQLHKIGLTCNLSPEVLDYYLLGTRSSFKRKPLFDRYIDFYPDRLTLYGKVIANSYLHNFGVAKCWFERTFMMREVPAALFTLQQLQIQGFYSIDYRTGERADRYIFPEYEYRRGDPQGKGTLVVKADYLFDLLAYTKYKESLTPSVNYKKPRKSLKDGSIKSKYKKANLRAANYQEMLAFDLSFDERTYEFMRYNGQKLVMEFKTPEDKF